MKIDIHAHVLPGIDDGARDWDMCLQMLAKSAECGVQRIIATPHYLPWRKNVRPDEIRRLCIEAMEKLESSYGISMDIYPGNEIYYSMGIVERLKNGDVLTLADSRYALIEFKTASSYQELCRAVRELRDGGYIPIIAHMERYKCLENVERVMELKDMGAMFQMNISSIQGGFFDSMSRRAKRFLQEGWIEFLASDMHDLEKRPPMKMNDFQWLEKKLGLEYEKDLLCSNADIVLQQKMRKDNTDNGKQQQ